MPTDTYSIVDLARLTGVNVRTIRYYLAQGLLPASGESGPGAHYGEGHLDRLRLTRRLQQQHLPLAEIRRRLAELTDNEVAGVLATTQEPAQAPTTSALDYIRSVLGGPSATPPLIAAPSASPAALPVAPRAAARLVRPTSYAAIGIVSEPAGAAPKPLASVATAGPAPAAEPATATEPSEPDRLAGPERSQWDRLSLGPNIELHIRRPLGRLEQKRVERLITIARQVLKEETP